MYTALKMSDNYWITYTIPVILVFLCFHANFNCHFVTDLILKTNKQICADLYNNRCMSLVGLDEQNVKCIPTKHV